MRSQVDRQTLDRVVAFHGHLCPGLTRGIRAAEIALREIGPHAEDEEVIAVVENDACAVDAIQFLVGCTFGKGNLFCRPYGKDVFTFARRSDGKAIRVVGTPRAPQPPDLPWDALVQRVRAGQGSQQEREAYDAWWRGRAMAHLEAEEGELFTIHPLLGYVLPARAVVLPTVRCESCGEGVMASRLHLLNGRDLCTPCYEALVGPPITMRPIGVIHNELQPDLAKPRETSAASTITVYGEFAAGMEGIEEHEQLEILFAFEPGPSAEAPLRQHRLGDASQPLRGVFALRSPRRPNPIGLTVVRLLRVEGNALTVAGLDAWDGTLVLDIKPHG